MQHLQTFSQATIQQAKTIKSIATNNKKSDRGELAESFFSRHPTLSKLDSLLGWFIIMFFPLLETITFVLAGINVCFNGMTAFDLMDIAGRWCTLSIAWLTFLFWHAHVYYAKWVRRIMLASTRFTPNGFMRGGILPIPAAASVGVLMFCLAVFVSTATRKGSDLQLIPPPGAPSNWPPGQMCRASAIQPADAAIRWGARFDRTAPWVDKGLIAAVIRTFKTLNLPEEVLKPVDGACFNAPHQFGRADIFDALNRPRNLTNFVNPQGDTEGRLCMYICTWWQNIKLTGILQSWGQISAGAGIVVVMAEYAVSKLGYEVVDEGTTPERLLTIFAKTGPQSPSARFFKPVQTSVTFVSAIIVSIYYFMLYKFTSKINSDGYYTQDYYVTFSLLYSVIMATLLRSWHLYQARPQIFTKRMWTQGFDYFIVTDVILNQWNGFFGKKEFQIMQEVGEGLGLIRIKIDLYQWMHLRGRERREMLTDYCRRPSKGDKDVDIVSTLATTSVTVKHHVDFGDGQITCRKVEKLPKGTQLKVSKWRDINTLFCTANIKGRDEELILGNDEVLESSEVWDQTCAKMLENQLITGDLLKSLLSAEAMQA